MAVGDYKSNYSGDQIDRVVEKGILAIKSVTIEGTTLDRITVPYGAITGALSNQADLSSALNAKQNTLTAGSNITITNNEISAVNTTYTAGTGISITNDTIAVDTTTVATKTDLSAKQDTLVSGTNIKTINNESLLTSGNINIKSASIVEDIEEVANGAVSLVTNKSIYKAVISANTTFTFDVSNLGTLTNKSVTFELYLDMSTVYTLAFPASVSWIEQPSFTQTGRYLLVFRTMDGGTTWLGNIEVKW